VAVKGEQMSPTIGLLHPGEMGGAVGAALVAGGARVLWASAGRSPASRRRATAAGLHDAGTVGTLVAESDIVLAVCPPHAARDLARAVAGHGFAGTYVDANAVAPATAREIAAIVGAAGAVFVDGGLVGPPPRREGTTRLYLSGPAGDAERVARAFAAGPLEAVRLDAAPGAASALKMAYAAWTKGSAALLMAVRALARAEGVDQALVREWERSQPDLPARSEADVRGSTAKAWRFVGEMEEIAATFAAAGLPRGFHEAAAEIYQRLTSYRDAAETPPFGVVVDALLGAAAGAPRPVAR
jgi:3-hydroxyisobutyrate dehydrogenase-like beta-hydroxyacid dehydrogenase